MKAKMARAIFLLNWPGRVSIPTRLWAWAEDNATKGSDA